MNQAKTFSFVFLIISLFLLSLIKVFGENPNESKIKSDISARNSNLAAKDYIGVYQKYLSNLRYGQCPMTPSCSNYALQVFQNTNFVKASFLTSDRLTRCGYDHQFYKISNKSNFSKLIDVGNFSSKEVYRLLSGQLHLKPFNDSSELNDFNFNFISRKIVEKDFKEALRCISQLEFEKKELPIGLFVNKLICLRGLGELEQVIFEYEIKCPDVYKIHPEVLFQVSLSSFYLGDNLKALKTLKLIDSTISTDSFGIEYKVNVLNSIILLEIKQFNESKKFANKISKPLVQREFIQNISFAESFKPKNKRQASCLAVVPGLGYIYTKHYQTALQSFIINGLLGYSTYTNFKVKNYGMGILTGLLGLSFYIGNIQGSAASAVRYNEKFMNSTKNHLFKTSQIN